MSLAPQWELTFQCDGYDYRAIRADSFDELVEQLMSRGRELGLSTQSDLGAMRDEPAPTQPLRATL
jgi:hypothetical protein